MKKIVLILTPLGHAVESRIYAESPARDFMPGSGTISYLRTPEEDLPRVRVDTGIFSFFLFSLSLSKKKKILFLLCF